MKTWTDWIHGIVFLDMLRRTVHLEGDAQSQEPCGWTEYCSLHLEDMLLLVVQSQEVFEDYRAVLKTKDVC